MKKIAMMLVAMVAMATMAMGQITHMASGQTDKTAEALLNKAASKLVNVRFRVTMTMLDADKKQQARQTADVVLSGSSYTLVSDDQEVMCDGTTVWYWNKSAGEVTVNDMPKSDELNLFNPGQMLTSYSENFRAKYIRTDDDGTAVVDLQPRAACSFHKIRLFIVESSGQLKRAEVHKYDSSREVYDFERYAYGRTRTSFTFDSKAHPEVEVIDMR